MRPCPVRMRAGRDGAAPPGGGAHISFGLTSGDLVSAAANRVAEAHTTANRLRRICLLQFTLNEVTQLDGRKRGAIHRSRELAIAAYDASLRRVRDESLLRPVIHSKSPGYDFDLRIRSGEKSPSFRARIPNFSVLQQDVGCVVARIDGDGQQNQILGHLVAEPRLDAREIC